MIKKNIALYFIFFILTSSFAEEKDKFVDSDLEADLTYIFTEMATQASSIDGTYFYTSGNKRDAIIQKATIETIDKELKILDDAGRKTIQYLAYAWCDYAALKGNEQDKNARIKTYLKAKENKIELVYQDIKNKGLNVDNINLQVTMYVYIINTVSVTVSGSSNVIAVSSHTGGAYIDRTLTKADLNTTCRNQIRDAITAEAKKQSSRNMLASPNQSLIWRAKLLKEKLLDCPTVPALSGDQSKDLVEMLKYVKSKVANKQQVLLHPAPETPAELIAENVKLGNATYTKLRFRNNSTVNPSFSDPLTYKAEVYDKSAAFIFYDKDKPTNQLFTIALFDEKNKEKKDSLEKWLMGVKKFNLNIIYGVNAVQSSIRPSTVKFLNLVMSKIDIDEIFISSTSRNASSQARAMFDDIVGGSPDNYTDAGTQVQQIFYDNTDGLTKQEIQASKKEILSKMIDKINELGPMNVSKHCSNPDEMNVIDIPLRYIDDYNKADDFVQILNSYKQSGWFDSLIYPGNNPNENVYHLQINVVE